MIEKSFYIWIKIGMKFYYDKHSKENAGTRFALISFDHESNVLTITLARIDQIGFEPTMVALKELCRNHLTTNPNQPTVSIALTSIDYKTIALLLC